MTICLMSDQLGDLQLSGDIFNDVIWNPIKSYRYFLVNSTIQNRKGISALTLLIKSFR